MLYDLNKEGETFVVIIGRQEYYIGTLSEEEKVAYVNRLSVVQEETNNELVVEVRKEVIKDILEKYNETKVDIENITQKQLEYVVIYLENLLL